MFTESDTVKYVISLIDDVSDLYTYYKAGKITYIDACAKYKVLKDFYKMLVMRGYMRPDDYKFCFVEYPTFNDFRAFMEADRWEV